jgi:hypothetical protein
MKKKDELEESRRHLALEVLMTLSETASGMVRKVKKQYLNELGKNKRKLYFLFFIFEIIKFLDYLT